MFRGLKALFTSGLIVDPMVLLGIIFGFVFIQYFDFSRFMLIVAYYDYYLVALSIAFLYTILFKRVFNRYGNMVNWQETTKRAIGNFAKLVIANILAVVFFDVLFTF